MQYALFFIYIQKKNNDINRQKAEEKGIKRRHRQKEVGIGRSQRNWQVKEIGRARKQTGQGKEKERQPARQGNKAVGEKDRLIILILCIMFAARNKYIK